MMSGKINPAPSDEAMRNLQQPEFVAAKPSPSVPSAITRDDVIILHGMPAILRNALSSTMGAAVVATTVTPLDVVKIRLQAHVCQVGEPLPCGDPLHVEGSLDAARKIFRSEGVRGFWRGLNVTLLLAIPTTGLYFTLYEYFRDQLAACAPDIPNPAMALMAGATARITTSTAASPLELARTSLQAGVGGPQATVISVLRDVRNTQGMAAWWRGLAPTLMRDAPFSAIYWTAYETLKDPKRSILPRHMFRPGNEFSVYLGAGIGAGGLAAICTVPPDVLKTRRQAMITRSAPGDRPRPVPTSFEIMKRIVSSEGVRGLFRGAGPRVAKVAPSCAIMMSSFELFKRLLGGRRDTTIADHGGQN